MRGGVNSAPPSRPRARGGCSGFDRILGVLIPSAPRSRGLLQPARHRGGPGKVGPALAGLAPGARPGQAGSRGRPRARGGCSCSCSPASTWSSSAPRSRGLLHRAVLRERLRRVGPALAGVARRTRSQASRMTSRPRARGGCSGRPGRPVPSRQSAPRSRGLLPLRRGLRHSGRVGPALAGVARGDRRGCLVSRGRPRARGGCSDTPTGKRRGCWSAPRSRGLLGVRSPADPRAGVGPALAGVAPSRSRRGGPAARRPRAREGCSRRCATSGSPRRSAPRSRGLLRGDGDRRGRAVVGPALAGVARSPWIPTTSPTGRPRARGGCSQKNESGTGGNQSAPRSRGLLPVGRTAVLCRDVGPALAGVAPVPRPSPCCS